MVRGGLLYHQVAQPARLSIVFMMNVSLRLDGLPICCAGYVTHVYHRLSGWWFGTFFCPYIGKNTPN